MRQTTTEYILAAAVVVALSGCAPTRDVPVFQPTYPVVGWQDLIPDAGPMPEDMFRILVEPPTMGVFPASLAVARVTATVSDEAPSPQDQGSNEELTLNTEPKVDFLRWNSTFDDVRPVSEVFPLSPIAMGGNRVTVVNMVDATQAVTGRLCLVYSTADLSEIETEIRGVLVQATTHDVLAAIHARAITPPLVDEETGKEIECDPQTGLAPVTPQVAAAERFQALARACLLKLIENDQPIAPTPEEGWIPEGPTHPQVWPPLPYAPPHGSPYPYPYGPQQ